jgi:hypothetical protein
MAIDLSKMKAKLDAIQNKNPGDQKFWRPQDGEQTVRIVPTPDGDPFKEFFFHYNVGNNRGFLCPKRNYGEGCAVCEFASQLWKEGSSNDDDEAKKMAKGLFARQRFFSPVLVRGEEDLGVRAWGYGKMAYESLLGLVLNPEYGDITDPESGTDLVMTYGKPSGASFPQTKLTPRRRSSPLCDEAVGGDERCAELLNNIPDFDTLYERTSPTDVEAMLDEYLSGDQSAETSSSETTKYTAPTTTSDPVDAAFDELMGA